VLTDISGNGSDDNGNSLAIQRDGKLVAAGHTSTKGVGVDFALPLQTLTNAVTSRGAAALPEFIADTEQDGYGSASFTLTTKASPRV
jgi:hypothetical protein